MKGMLTMRIEEALLQRIEEEARRSGRSKGDVVREALRRHLRDSRPTALDAVRQHIGCVQGPADLSTNKKHLSGLGRRKK